jgi:predicted permease
LDDGPGVGYFGSISAGIFDATAPTGYSSQAIKQFKDYKLAVYPASGGVSGLREEYNRSLWLLLGITGLVLLIACANLANLMLARANARGREVALRMALGASRVRLLRQLLIESGLLALTGTVLGIVLAQVFSRVLIWSLSTKDWSVKLEVGTDWRVLLFAAALSAITCAVFGTVPAMRASRSNPVQAMKAGDGRVAGSRENLSVQRLMVITQISVSMVLLVGAFLFVHSFRNLLTFDPGVRKSGITVARFGYFQLHVDKMHFAEFEEQLLQDVRAVPGVRSAATTRWVPLTPGSWTHQVHSGEVEAPSKFTWVSPGFFQTMGISLMKGRDFNSQDTAASPHVAIVNQAFVRKFLPGVNPVGQLLRTLPEPQYPGTTFEIVGTIPDTKYSDVRDATPPMAFAPSLQFPVEASGPWAVMVVDSPMLSENVSEAIKQMVKQKYPAVIFQSFDLETSIHDGLLRQRLMAILSGFFGLLAAVLVMVGLYGLMSYLVTLRRNEIGIRIALGSQRWQVVRLVMRDAATMLVAGVVVGNALSLIAGHTVSSMLFGLKPYDLATVASAILLLALVAFLASFLPARKASRLDPMAALRCE